MLRFAPNFHHLFLELPIRDRFAAAASIGCTAVEWHFPYELPAAEVAHLLADNGLELVYAVVPADWPAGDFGLGAQPGRQEEFRKAADVALEYIQACDLFSINVGAGTVPEGEDRDRCIDTYVENLAWLAAQGRGLRCRFVIEPVCSHRHPRWALHSMAEGAGVVDRVGQDNVRLVYDTFHLRMEEKGPLSAIMDTYWDRIGYVQIGNPPGRHEPGEGELDLLWLVRRAVAKGYEGAIGLELDPARDSWSSLEWMNAFGYSVVPPS